jgi:hypothetical protein
MHLERQATKRQTLLSSINLTFGIAAKGDENTLIDPHFLTQFTADKARLVGVQDTFSMTLFIWVSFNCVS